MWKLISEPRTLEITKELAVEFAKMEAVPGDRTIKPYRTRTYRKILQEGRFRPVTWATVYCKETGKLWRVNGKHTSNLFAEIEDFNVVQPLYAIIEEYECDTEEDAARLYGTFDNGTATRTSSETNSTFARTIELFNELPKRHIDAAVSGMEMGLNGLSNTKTLPVERAEHMVKYPNFVLWFSDLLSGGPEKAERGNRHMMRQPVVAIMFQTWQISELDATEFWQHVRDQTGPDPRIGDRRLAMFLTIHSTSKEDSDENRKHKTATPKKFYYVCITAWNSWMNLTTTQLKYHPYAEPPKLVKVRKRK